MLRGNLVLKLLKPSKIKTITLTFKGRARTDWPDGIPPKKADVFEEEELMTHTWPFFNAQFSCSESSCGANFVRIIDSSTSSVDLNRVSMDSVSSFAPSDTPPLRPSTPSGANSNLSAMNGGAALLGIPYGQSRPFIKEDKTTTQSRGYRTFAAGEYVYPFHLCILLTHRYNFELPLDSVLPESIECNMGSVRYELEATIERSGAFKSNLSGKTEVLLIRNPGEQNLEINEPISVTRTWYSPNFTLLTLRRDDQLHYEILVSGKAFPINGVIPIAFKFTPLAKVRLHRIKVYLSENIEYHSQDKKFHRLEPTRKLLLFDKQAQKSGEVPLTGVVERAQSFVPPSTESSSGIGIFGSRPTANPLRPGSLPRMRRSPVGRRAPLKDDLSLNSLLGNLEGGDSSGVSTEFEVNIPLPGCQVVRTPNDPRNKDSPLMPLRFHHTTIWPNIVVHHWIKIVLRISKADENSENKNKRRHFEISIDSPIHLLSVPSRVKWLLNVVSFSRKYVSSSL
jgi:hypothetical protein